MRSVTLILCAGLAACTQFPDVERSVSAQAEAADYPDLVPIGPLLAAADAEQIDAQATQTQLSARVAALRAKAARLRRGVVTGSERVRLENGLE
ncbi:MAG: hypothetical protein WBC93_21850 [Sulfitobacter sp.]